MVEVYTCCSINKQYVERVKMEKVLPFPNKVIDKSLLLKEQKQKEDKKRFLRLYCDILWILVDM